MHGIYQRYFCFYDDHTFASTSEKISQPDPLPQLLRASHCPKVFAFPSGHLAPHLPPMANIRALPLHSKKGLVEINHLLVNFNQFSQLKTTLPKPWLQATNLDLYAPQPRQIGCLFNQLVLFELHGTTIAN